MVPCHLIGEALYLTVAGECTAPCNLIGEAYSYLTVTELLGV